MVAATLPLYPFNFVLAFPSALFMTIFSTPPTPSASYFAPGFVTTSIDFTAEAGIALNICEGLEENITLGFPST